MGIVPRAVHFYVLIVKELQCDTGFLQFFVNVFVIRASNITSS